MNTVLILGLAWAWVWGAIMLYFACVEIIGLWNIRPARCGILCALWPVAWPAIIAAVLVKNAASLVWDMLRRWRRG